jgi:hypothetical protein
MFAHHDEAWLLNLGSRAYVKAHGLRHPIVEVLVTLVADDDPSATHWGWLAREDEEPSMIWPHLGAYHMCFPYGPRAEEEHGRGRTVRLHVAPLEEGRDTSI